MNSNENIFSEENDDLKVEYEIIDIESFEKAYSESKGRPFTEWDDLKISYAANSSFLGGSKLKIKLKMVIEK